MFRDRELLFVCVVFVCVCVVHVCAVSCAVCCTACCAVCVLCGRCACVVRVCCVCVCVVCVVHCFLRFHTHARTRHARTTPPTTHIDEDKRVCVRERKKETVYACVCVCVCVCVLRSTQAVYIFILPPAASTRTLRGILQRILGILISSWLNVVVASVELLMGTNLIATGILKLQCANVYVTSQ